MSMLAQVIEVAGRHEDFVTQQAMRARNDPAFRRKLLQRWRTARHRIGEISTPTGLKLPRLALPQTDEPGEIARYLFGEGLPGEFPFVNAAYRVMYLAESEARDPKSDIE